MGKDLQNYVHFRAPTSVACLRALARTDVQFYSNFLDPLKEDLPKGCWASDRTLPSPWSRCAPWFGRATAPTTFLGPPSSAVSILATDRRIATCHSSSDSLPWYMLATVQLRLIMGFTCSHDYACMEDS